MPEPLPPREPPRPLASRSPWLLRTTAVTGFFAALTGVLIAPGLRGLAGDHVVEGANRVAWTLAYFFVGLLVALIGIAAFELSMTVRFQSISKAVGVSATGLAGSLAAPALLKPLPAGEAIALALVTSFVVLCLALGSLRTNHTRAVGFLMSALALAGLLRVVAWYLARRAGDAGDAALYADARGLATAAVVCEVLAQMVAAAWLGTRSRFTGQALSSFAIGLAFVLTYGAARGAGASGKPWEVAAHVALASTAALPQPYAPNSLLVFLVASSVLLAGVAALQGRQVVAVVAALSFSLVGRGAFDIPIHALAACAAALWLTVAVTDPRAMWESLLAASPRREPAPARVPAAEPSQRTP